MDLVNVHKLIWKPNYSVRVAELDLQHKRIFDFINLLNEALTSHNRSVVITVRDVLHELDDHVKNHFKNEEKYFDKFNYENSEGHIQEHKEYAQRIALFNKRLETVHREGDNMTTFALDLFEFLESWWTHHVTHDDHKYIKCFNEHGLF